MKKSFYFSPPLIKIIDERAGDQFSFTLLQSQVFNDKDVKIKLNNNLSVPVGAQYDAIDTVDARFAMLL